VFVLRGEVVSLSPIIERVVLLLRKGETGTIPEIHIISLGVQRRGNWNRVSMNQSSIPHGREILHRPWLILMTKSSGRKQYRKHLVDYTSKLVVDNNLRDDRQNVVLCLRASEHIAYTSEYSV
jgi:hypothetical protein